MPYLAGTETALFILVVDDHPAARQLLEMYLQKAGYRVLAASNGRDALETLRRHFCPLVLTDWVMPEMDGLALCPAELLARLKTGRRILELENTLKQRNEEIIRLSVTDPLTGVYNRRYLNDTLPAEIRRACRYGRPLGLILCDLDHFKRINDTYGHNAGDLVLREFAAGLRSAIREGIDWLARFGGEEFVLVLPETDLAGSVATAERLRCLSAERVIISPLRPASGFPGSTRMLWSTRPPPRLCWMRQTATCIRPRKPDATGWQGPCRRQRLLPVWPSALMPCR